MCIRHVCLLLSDVMDGAVNKCISDWCQRTVVHREVGLCDLCYQRSLNYSLNEAVIVLLLFSRL